MLGINTPWDRAPRPYRNYAAVNPGDAKFVEMESAGLVERYREADANNAYDYYRCTDAGRTAAMRSHREIRYTRGERRYIAFLNVRDSFQDLTFREFLTLPEFREARQA